MEQTSQETHSKVQARPRPAGALHFSAEGEVVDALARGDKRAAIDLLIEEHGRMIQLFCQKMLHDAALAEDVYQIVFLQAFEALGSFEGRASFRGWLYSIAYHRCLDAKKARLRWSSRFIVADEPVEVPDPASSCEDRLAASILAGAMERGMAELPPRVRAAVRLRYQEGLTYEQIARLFEERAATVQARVSRALPLLRRSLVESGFAP
jgi:RNA polymerase sigma factor (sigma-70 family)